MHEKAMWKPYSYYYKLTSKNFKRKLHAQMNIVASRSHGAKYGLLPDEILVRGSKAIYKNITYYFCSSLPITTSNPILKAPDTGCRASKKSYWNWNGRLPCWLAFMVPEGAIRAAAAGREKTSSLPQLWTLQAVKSNLLGKRHLQVQQVQDCCGGNQPLPA